MNILEKEVINLKEFSELTGLSRSTIYKKTMNKTLTHYKVGRLCYFKLDDVKKYLLANKVDSEDQLDS